MVVRCNQSPDQSLRKRLPNHQGSLSRRNKQCFHGNIYRKSLFSLLLTTCLILHNLVQAKAESFWISDIINTVMSLFAAEPVGIDDTFVLIEKGMKLLKFSMEFSFVLILGNQGSGKTTLTQFMAGDDSKLISWEAESGSGEYAIRDENHHVTKDVDLKGVLPEKVVDGTTGLVYYDCPGFSDSRSPAYDIAYNYFVKKVVDNARSIKVVLTVSYSSVSDDEDSADFLNLLRYTSVFIKDVIKFENGTGLVVTKVDNQYLDGSGRVILVPDEKVIENIANFIRKVNETLTEMRKDSPWEEEDILKSMLLLEIFLKTEHGEYVNIAIFRRPDKAGAVSGIPLLQNGKKLIKAVIEDNVKFTKKDESDFGFSVSDESKSNVFKLVDKIKSHFLVDVSEACAEIGSHIKAKIKTSNIYKLKEYAHSTHGELMKTRKKLESCSSNKVFIRVFTDFITVFDIKSSRKIFLDVLKEFRYLDFLELVSNENLYVKTVDLVKPLRSVIEDIANLEIWYTFLIDFHEKLSSHKMYTDLKDTFGAGMSNKPDGKLVDIHVVLQNIGGYGLKYYEEIKQLDLDWRKQKEINDVINSVFSASNSLECLGDTLIVKRVVIKFSDLDFTNPCSAPVKTIKLFALNAIHIDTDFDSDGKTINIFFIAPKLETIDNQVLTLDGVSYNIVEGIFAEYDGLSGRPGGDGGNIVAGGLEMRNSVELKVSAFGGNGAGGHSGEPCTELGDRYPWLPGASLEEGLKIIEKYPFEIGQHTTTVDWESLPSIITGTYATLEMRYYVVHEPAGASLKQRSETEYTKIGGAGGKAGTKGKVLAHGLIDLKYANILGEDGINGYEGCGLVAKNLFKSGITCSVYHGIKRKYFLGTHTKTIILGWLIDECLNSGSKSERNYLNPFKIYSAYNEYKAYSIANVNDGVQDHIIIKLYLVLCHDNALNDNYDAYALYQELMLLENRFYNFREMLEIRDLYKCLLERIDKYSKSPKKHEKTVFHKKFIRILRTAAYSKMLTFRDKDASYDLVVDSNRYFAFIEANMEKIKFHAKEIAIRELNENFKKKIDAKIFEAQNFLNTLVIPSLAEDASNIGKQFVYLVDEIKRMQSYGQANLYRLMQKKRQLENHIRWKSWLDGISFIGGIFKYFGIIGKIIGNVIQTITNVADSFSPSPSLPNLEVLVPDGAMSVLNGELTKLENKVQDEAKAVGKFLDKVLQETNKDPYQLHQVHKATSTLKNKLKTEQTSGKLTYSFVQSIMSKCQEILQNNELRSYARSKTRSIIKNLLTTSQVAHYASGYYVDEADDEAKLKLVSGAIAKQKLALHALDQYKTYIFDKVIPLLSNIYKNIQKFLTAASSLPEFLREILHLQISSSLRDVKVLLRKLTVGFNVHDTIQSYLDKTDETLTVLMHVYEKIDRYNEGKELADYMADIISPNANIVTSTNHTLNEAVKNINRMIDYDIVTGQLQKAIYSFKQFVFPFSSHYLQDYQFDVPPTYGSNLVEVVNLASSQVHALHSKLLEHDYTIQNSLDVEVYEEYFQTGAGYTGPFYVWSNSEYEDTISRILNLEKIVLKSNIALGTHEKNAIKFKEIQFSFRSEDKQVSAALKKQLLYFDITIKHSGHSYYRCDNTFYLIRSDSQTIYYSFAKDARGEPIRKNYVYTKLKNGQYMLSPYTMWTIQLKHILNSGDLNDFVGKVDLELNGQGQYVSPKSPVCNRDVRKYYETVDTISVTDIIHKKR